MEQFTDLNLYAETLAVLSVAVLLSAVLAFHPSTRRNITTRAEFEQPKTMVLYGLVGALVAHIVRLNEMMALVIFGIGGLMRFRTVVGEAKDTGRVILVAIVGICCGLQSYLIAVLSTVFGWVIIGYLERTRVSHVEIVGLAPDFVQKSAAAYRTILRESGCRIVEERRNARKGQLDLFFVSSSETRELDLTGSSEVLDSEIRGHEVWKLS